jgi:Kef-type K+ transport system membrane component KefB
MDHLSGAQFLGLLAAMLCASKLMGWLARKVGQPAVLGELLAGVLIGKHALGLINPTLEVWHLLSEFGVVLLLFTIGLAIDLEGLLRVGPVSALVAVVGVVFPFLIGYVTCRMLGLETLPSVLIGAALTATSVGITAKVLAELGRLHSAEGQVVLGAAVIDDVVGLIILTVVSGVAFGESLTFGKVLGISASAFGFLVAALVVAAFIVPRTLPWIDRFLFPGSPTIPALVLAFGLAWMAQWAGSAGILGAFAAGLIVAKTTRRHDVEQGLIPFAELFIPLFFVVVGASVDLRVLNPLETANHRTLLIAALLTVGAVIGKLAAGYAPFWIKGQKSLIGAGMIPRGEVGLIFAQLGFSSGVLDPGQFAAVTLVVMATTLLAPPLLKYLSATDRKRVMADAEKLGHHPQHETGPGAVFLPALAFEEEFEKGSS